VEVGDDGAGAAAGEAEGLGVTVCHGDGLAVGGMWGMLIQILP
jgi:hypothetical protein